MPATINKQMKKIAINNCYGGFGLSHKAILNYAKRKGIELHAYDDERGEDGSRVPGRDRYLPYVQAEGTDDPWFIYYTTKPIGEDGKIHEDTYFATHDFNRDDPDLISVIAEMGSKAASGMCANLKIVEIPDDIEWEIDEYDGMESIHEKHRSWS